MATPLPENDEHSAELAGIYDRVVELEAFAKDAKTEIDDLRHRARKIIGDMPSHKWDSGRGGGFEIRPGAARFNPIKAMQVLSGPVLESVMAHMPDQSLAKRNLDDETYRACCDVGDPKMYRFTRE